MTTPDFRENTATHAGRRVIAALEAHDFDALAALFHDDYVEVIQRNADAPIPRDEMLRGIRLLVEEAGGMGSSNASSFSARAACSRASWE